MAREMVFGWIEGWLLKGRDGFWMDGGLVVGWMEGWLLNGWLGCWLVG